ncbi:hypothetical protein ACJX0J_039485 [Zea mays]
MSFFSLLLDDYFLFSMNVFFLRSCLKHNNEGLSFLGSILFLMNIKDFSMNEGMGAVFFALDQEYEVLTTCLIVFLHVSISKSLCYYCCRNQKKEDARSMQHIMTRKKYAST